jgi:hypothetical protein
MTDCEEAARFGGSVQCPLYGTSDGKETTHWVLGIVGAVVLAGAVIVLPVHFWDSEENGQGIGVRVNIEDPAARAKRAEAALRKAGALDANTQGGAIRKIVQEAASGLETIRIGTKIGTPEWQKLVLNKGGKGVDAIRFRVPKGPSQNLYWAMVLPEGKADVWELCAAKGEVGGQMARREDSFETFTNFPEQVPKEGKLILQRLSGEHLEGGNEYVIWFHFTTQEPVEIWTAITLRRKGNRDWRVFEVMGLKLK